MGHFICDQSTVVETKAGKLRGFCMDGIYQFRGIRYARAKRFQMPEEPESWEGVRDALDYGFNCVGPDQPRRAPHGEVLVPHRYWPESEHCQYLNIWTDSLEGDTKKAVMVWIHGGGYADGSAIEMEAYDGFRMAKEEGVVFVSLNHRLNVFGFLDVSDFGEEYANSVNAGIADLVAALRWIQNNIRQFGGDPGNVTIVGQSGGGGKVCCLNQVPAAEGLFHRSIVMSGVIPDDNMLVRTTVPAKELVYEIMKQLDLGEDQFDRLLACPEIPLVRAVKRACIAIEKRGGKVGWGPRKNGWYLGYAPCEGVAEFSKKIPMMVGNVLAEFSVEDGIPDKSSLPVEERERIVKAYYGEEKGEKMLSLFRRAYPNVNEVYATQLDTFFRKDTLPYLRVKAKESDAPVYSYMFALEFGLDGGKMSWHCADIPFAFRNTDKVPVCGMGEVTGKLEAQTAGAFAAFAKTGNPNHEGLPAWAPCSKEHLVHMVFDRKSEAYEDHDNELIRYALEVLPERTIDFYPEEEDGTSWIY